MLGTRFVGGFGWIASAMWRMDQHFARFRSELPHLKRMPPEYVREQFLFTTQPIDEPDGVDDGESDFARRHRSQEAQHERLQQRDRMVLAAIEKLTELDPAAVAEPAPEGEAQTPVAAPARPRGDAVLVIDDDPGSREVLSQFLGKKGFRVEVAAGGAEGAGPRSAPIGHQSTPARLVSVFETEQ